jgi:hypothetical protein
MIEGDDCDQREDGSRQRVDGERHPVRVLRRGERDVMEEREAGEPAEARDQ